MSAPQTTETTDKPAATGWTRLKDVWELVVKVVASGATAFGISFSVYQYNHKMAEEKRMEFKRNLYQRKLAAYEKVGTAVAGLLTISKSEDEYFNPADSLAFDSCEREFRRLYWGVLPLVEDSSVEMTMIRFRDQVRYYRRGEDPYAMLMESGVALMDTCKRSLERYWARKSQFEEEHEEE